MKLAAFPIHGGKWKISLKGMKTVRSCDICHEKKMRKMLKLKTVPPSGWVGAASLQAQGAGDGPCQSSEYHPWCDLEKSMQLH